MSISPANRNAGMRRARTDPDEAPTKEHDLLMTRFGFGTNDLKTDVRLSRALRRKRALDLEIKRLIESGAMDRKVRRCALLMGWTSFELADDPRIADLVKAIIESRQYLLTLSPRTKTAGQNPATKPAEE